MGVQLAVKVPFYGDTINVIPADVRGGEMIVLRHTCEALGIGYEGQFKRLQRQPWATIDIMSTVGSDGKTRQMACIDRRTFMMFLATIDTNRLANDTLRSKVVLYQKDAARVLDEHFSGPSASAEQPTAWDALATQAKLAVQIIEKQREMERRQLDQEVRLGRVEDRVGKLERGRPDATLDLLNLTRFLALKAYFRERGRRYSARDMRRLGRWATRFCLENGIAVHKPKSNRSSVNRYPAENFVYPVDSGHRLE